MKDDMPIATVRSSAPPAAGRRERKRAQTRERIFRAAMELFGQRGFFNTTVEDITEAADVGKGTFFNYFPSKEEVFSVLYETQLSKVNQARARAQSGDFSLRDLLRSFVRQIAEEPGSSQHLARGLIATVVSSEAVRQMHMETMKHGRQILGEVLKLGQARGEVRRDLTPEEMVRVLQQSLTGTVLLWSLDPSSGLQKRLDTMFEIYWAGISVPGKGRELL
jgi:AcrR family transcriptional regulator